MPDIDRPALEAWITAVRKSGEFSSINRWTQAAGVAPPTVGRFLNRDHKSISPANIAKLAAVTSVPLPEATRP